VVSGGLGRDGCSGSADGGGAANVASSWLLLHSCLRECPLLQFCRSSKPPPTSAIPSALLSRYYAGQSPRPQGGHVPQPAAAGTAGRGQPKKQDENVAVARKEACRRTPRRGVVPQGGRRPLSCSGQSQQDRITLDRTLMES
jgi:hypothetical protein